MTNTPNVVVAAKRLAVEAHHDQMRLGAKPVAYIEHCRAVADIVGEYHADDITTSAAWLHDALEDTQLLPSQITKACGAAVLGIVLEVTDDVQWKHLTLFARKERQAARMGYASDRARLIKLADQLANLRDMMINPPEGWTRSRQHIYANGMAWVVDACRATCPKLAAHFDRLVTDFRLLRPVV